VGGYEVTAFSVSHDAAHPLGFTVSNGNEKVGYVTDTGFISRGVKKAVSGCDVIVAESNHDKELLLRGSYPERLKRRILSDKGHLCNDESALFCRDLAENGAKRIMLAHISENNNLAELAYWTAYHSLAACGAEKCDVTLRVALQRETVII
jgi:phosphoribosyl 1,2-cyclic phosphodiesterase